jgi:hypothetical protein
MDKLKILKFSQFTKVFETSEFNLQRFNSDSVQASVSVDDPSLSINAFDKNQDMIRQAMSRINDIMYNLKGTNAYKALRSKLALEEQDITALKVLRIVKSTSLKYDVYIAFTIGEEEYWGVVEDMMSPSPDFTSEVFKDYDLYQPKEWVIKIKGLIIKTLKAWLKPEPGMYRLLNNEVYCYSTETGKQLKMEAGIEIELIRAHNDKIIIKHDTDIYNLVGDNYIYFNWWFEKLEQ